MHQTIKIDLKRYSYLKDYFSSKYGGSVISFSKGHKIHRKLEFLLTCNPQCARFYTTNYIEIEIPNYECLSSEYYTMLTEKGEHTILQFLRNEFFADFEEYADEARELGPQLIADTFISRQNLDPGRFDMLVKHLQRRPEKKQKNLKNHVS